LEIMLASAKQHVSEECVTGYTVKTGALHRIIGTLVGNGFSVSIPLALHPSPAPQAAGADWLPMETAPKDGTMVWLLVDYTGEDACHPLEDAPQAQTIGANTDDNMGPEEGQGWLFAGWSWEQDCFTQGQGKPIGWRPLATSGAADAIQGLIQEHSALIPDPSDDEVDLLLAQIDQIARGHDSDSYGLPTRDEDRVQSMRAQVNWFFGRWIAAALPPPGRWMVPMEEIPLKVNQLIGHARRLQGFANRLETTNALLSKEVRAVAYDVEKSAQGIYDSLPDSGIKEGS